MWPFVGWALTPELLTCEYGPPLELFLYLAARFTIPGERCLKHEPPYIIIPLEVRLPVLQFFVLEMWRDIADLHVGIARVEILRVDLCTEDATWSTLFYRLFHKISINIAVTKYPLSYWDCSCVTHLGRVHDELHISLAVLFIVHGFKSITDLCEPSDLWLLVYIFLPVLFLKECLQWEANTFSSPSKSIILIDILFNF